MNHDLAGERVPAVRKEDSERGAGSQTALAHVAHYTYHLRIQIALPLPQNRVLADGTFIGKDQLRQPLADHHAACRDWLAAFRPNRPISFIEQSSLEYRQPDRAKIARRDYAPSRPRDIAPGQLLTGTGSNSHPGISSLHRPMAYCAG